MHPADPQLSTPVPCVSNSVHSSVSAPVFNSSETSVIHSSTCNPPTVANKSDLFWHQRLGHIPFARMKSISFLSDKISSKQPFLCTVCPMARQQRLPFHDSTIHSSVPFQLVHIDIWGPCNTSTYNGFRYFLTLVDDFTRVTWTHLLSCKSNTLSILKAFLQLVKVQFKSTIQCFRSDNAYELGSSTASQQFFTDNGILHQTTIPHTPQQNGVVERKHKHLLEVSRALIFQSKLPLRFWGECVLTATYIINRILSTSLHNISPFEKLNGTVPTYDYLEIFWLLLLCCLS